MNVTIGDNTFKVKLCTTQKSISEGMMGKNFNETFNGMLFMMPSKTEQSFWMYNCIIPLDIIMIDGDTINTINYNCEPCTNNNSCELYKGFGDKVLEIAGGTCERLGIKKGDRVSFNLF
jgi:uncharacterized membrane protein (UPF0127 family)